MRREDIPRELALVPQDAIKACFIDEPGYNAAWDYHITPEGRHFIPCCAEGSFCKYVKLYEYLPGTNEMKLCFDMESSVVTHYRTIRPSKIHTSLNSLPDGRVIMCTHTTANAPAHPYWLPEPYFNHMWEGYMGSNVLIYDPATGKVEDLGIPVPRGSFYGAKYIKEHNCLFLSELIKGHAYRFNLDDRSVVDYGQCMEFGVYLLADGPDGNVYFSTRSGALWRYNVKTMQPEYTGADIPKYENTAAGCFANNSRNVLGYAQAGPDGKLYFLAHPYSERFYAYDPRTNEIEALAYTRPDEIRKAKPVPPMAMGLAFDRNGVIWYTINNCLCSIDIMDPDAKPCVYGRIGTESHGVTCVESVHIREDILYITSTNHDLACPGVYAVDLRKLKEVTGEPVVVCQDVVLYFDGTEPVRQEYYKGDLMSDGKRLLEIRKEQSGEGEFLKRNPHHFGDGKKYVCKLWKTFGTDGSQVKYLHYAEDGTLKAYVEANGGQCVTVKDGEIVKIEKVSEIPVKYTEKELEEKFAAYTLPAHPGRQYIAKATAYGKMADGSLLVGTGDGMLAVIRNSRVYGLGAVCNDGGIHDITVCPGGERAYGVGGDPDSLGMVFSYDCEYGLRLEGSLYYKNGCDGKEGTGISCQPRCIAISPDGKRAAVGVWDHLGCVYEIDL